MGRPAAPCAIAAPGIRRALAATAVKAPSPGRLGDADFSDGWSAGLSVLNCIPTLSHAGDATLTMRDCKCPPDGGPDDAIACYDEATALLGLGRYEEALAGYDRAVALDPRRAASHMNRGLVLQHLRRYEDALASYDAAIALDPSSADAHNDRGTALETLGRPEQALASYATAAALDPGHAVARFNQGNALRALGHLDAAVASYDQAIALRPDHADAHVNRGSALLSLGRHEEALAGYDRATALRPDYADAFYNQGLVLTSLGRHDEAVARFDRTIGLQPDHADAHTGRGHALVTLRRHDEARASYDRAIALEGDDVRARFGKASLELALGNYRDGWPLYESRWQFAEVRPLRRTFGQPLWQGPESLEGKTILLHAEQGLGDTIQYCRYVPVLAARGARIVLEVQPPLAGLFGSLAGGATIVARGDPLPPFDLHCPLMSVPGRVGTTLETIPAQVPYLAAEAQRVAFWRERLPADGLRIGIVWQGNPANPVDRGRSAPLAAFAPLARVPGVRLISLQSHNGLDQLDRLPAGMTVASLGSGFDCGPDTFLDAAAAIMSLDLVISVDTSMVHLAGALGRPVWVALMANPQWTWLIDREDSPWYPSARLFRQTADGDWRGVFERMADEFSGGGPRRECKSGVAAEVAGVARTTIDPEQEPASAAPRKLSFVLAAADHGTMIVSRLDYRMRSPDSGFGVGYQILETGAFDRGEVSLANSILDLRRKYFGDGVLAIDCGANVGVHTIEWSKRMTGWGAVVAIEAQERLYYALAGNIALNNCFNATALNAAVTDGPGVLGVPQANYLAPGSFGSLELRRSPRTEFIGQEIDYSDGNLRPVQAIAIDQLDLPRIDFIKIDIEGMEMEALEGAARAIERCRPALLIEAIKVDATALREWLAARGYEVFPAGINLLALHASDPLVSHVAAAKAVSLG